MPACLRATKVSQRVQLDMDDARPTATAKPMIRKFSLADTVDETLQVWHVKRLWKLARALPVKPVPLTHISCLDETIWFSPIYGVKPTCRRVAAHAKRIYEADCNTPVILSATGLVMDGMHRVAKAWILGRKTVRAVKFPRDPEPDETLPLPPNLQRARTRNGKQPRRAARTASAYSPNGQRKKKRGAKLHRNNQP